MTIAIERPGLVVHQGDALAVLRTLGSESVHCCICSPPYLGLRRYVAPGDPDAALEVGQEATPAAFVARLVGIFREVRRVLRSDGTAWINIGDGYADDSKWGGATGGKHVAGLHGDTGIGRAKRVTGVPAKNLLLVPERLAIALQDDGWIVRSKIRWCKVACMPESVADRPTSAVEEILMLAKSPRYFYDAAAVAESTTGHDQGTRGVGEWNKLPSEQRNGRDGSTLHHKEGTRNMRNYWLLSPAPFSAARLGVVGAEHYASYPPELVRRVLACSTSDKGCCTACAAPWARVVERTASENPSWAKGSTFTSGKTGARHAVHAGQGPRYERGVTVGWAPTCACKQTYCPACAIVIEPETVDEEFYYNGGPIPPLSTDVRAVRTDIPGVAQGGALVQSDLSGAPHKPRPKVEKSGEVRRQDSGPEGIHPYPPPGKSDGEPRGIRDGTPPGDGGSDWTASPARRSCPPPERHQRRQPAGKSSGRTDGSAQSPSETAETADHLPPLRGVDRPVRTCPHCGGLVHERPYPTRPSVVLDPFAGSGTTLATATKMGRSAVGIELNRNYLPIIAARNAQAGMGFFDDEGAAS